MHSLLPVITFSALLCLTSYMCVPRRRIRSEREGMLRLVGGKVPYEGNVEVYHRGKFGGICDDEFDQREADITCKNLGFGKAVKATHNSEFGRGRKLIWMDNLYCTGKETRLISCPFDGWGIHDCTEAEAAGVVCKPKTNQKLEKLISKKPAKLKAKMKLQDKGIEVRLMGGRTPNEGRIEVRFGNGSWGLICADGWSLFEANVVCKELRLGFGQIAVQSAYFGGSHDDIIVSGVKCSGRESHISECVYEALGDIKCPGFPENIAGVMCAEELPDLVPDELEIEKSAYLEDKEIVFLQCAMEENCLSSEVNELDKNDYGYLYEKRRLLRFTARIANIGTADFKPFLAKPNWQWHMCHMHYHSMEVFAHFDVIDLKGNKVAEGHKASFCLEDSNCWPGVEKKYACANYGDQGISINCTDTYLSNIDCQWVDITSLAPGLYNFKVSINPEFKVAELSFDNNAALCKFYYNAVSARLFNCTLQRP